MLMDTGVALPAILDPVAVLENYTWPVLRDFEVTAHPIGEPEAFVVQVRQASPRYRGDDMPSATRYMLESDSRCYAPQVERHIMTAAGSLAMLNGDIPFVAGRSNFDAAFALGAARAATGDRAIALGKVIVSGDITARQAGVLTSGRELGDGETAAAKVVDEDYRDNEEKAKPTEHVLGRAAVRIALSETGVDLLHVEVDNPKADTAATVREAIRQLDLQEGGRVGGVTQSIYYAKQGLGMIEASMEVGITAAIAGCASDPSIVAKRTPSTYLAEVLSVARQAQRVLLASRK